MLKVLAFDYGASSGRAVLGTYDGEKIALEDIHRFANDPVMAAGSFYWDTLRLYHEMKQGLLKALKGGHGDIAGMAIDTWGVDFGLIGPSGNLIGMPYHYRDARTDGIMEKAAEILPLKEIYKITGIQFLKFNTIFQLLAMKLSRRPELEAADKMLFMPDLFAYFLTGEKNSEYTIASTSQLINAVSGTWSEKLISALGFDRNLFAGIIQPGTIAGKISGNVAEELGIERIPVIAVAEHDTGSAVMSVPAGMGSGGKFAYLSSGTWSLLGIESDKPVLSDSAYKYNYTNEGGFNRTIRLLKNIMGLWIHQECKRAWDKEDVPLSFDELEDMASDAEPFRSFIDVDDDIFFTPGGMPEKIAGYCRDSGQPVPESKGSIVRCVMESLAMKYRSAVEGLEEIAGYRLPLLHIVGGGSRNVLLCRYTANAIGRPVITGPVEATATGNILCQLIALKELKGIKDAREIVRKSFPSVEYQPEDTNAWDEAYAKYMSVCE
ncbi:MAG: rhamnulokinase [Eubacteriales bacterium]|nr:rhamnulokinase [Eubacteriales bacterium]